MGRFRATLVAVVVALLVLVDSGAGQEQSDVDFAREIRPIFAKHCFSCHGPDTSEGGLRLDRRDVVFTELESGETPVVPGKLERSHLWHRVSATDEGLRMPPEGPPLSRAQLESIERWVRQGAAWEQHWSFRPAERPEIPRVGDADWVRNPIDAFILSRLEAGGLRPAKRAEPLELIRRAYYDLTGLPPSPGEIDRFLADPSPAAYERIIDRLLESPRYGEKWARHWMDVVRYAETNGYERDGKKDNVWKYRDYLIRAFNEDKPFDRFIIEQLAGDELDEPTAESIIATGYYRLGLWDDEPVDREQAFYDGLDDIVRTTSEGFLGLTLGCARCHEHKIDPIPQEDYYRMLAFFRNLEHGNTQRPISTTERQRVHERFMRERQEKLDELNARIDEFEQRVIATLSDEEKRQVEDRRRGRRLLAQRREAVLNGDELRRYGELVDERRGVERSRPPELDTALAVQERGDVAPETYVLVRGIAQAKTDLVEPGFPLLLTGKRPELPERGRDGSSRRRLALARWIASPDNLLTARVAVNRVWQHHFGRGIVRSPNNFGQLGSIPTHPDLLNWLGDEFARNGWRVKALHKMIMMSNTYQMSSKANSEGLEQDPNNDLFWRFDMRRLTAEEIRDSVLLASGTLNLKMYGPSVYPELPAEVLKTSSKPDSAWGRSSPDEAARRSIYVHVKRSLRPPMMSNFDAPDTDTSCEARIVTTVPTQALSMLNGDFVNKQADLFARRLEAEHPDDLEAQVRRAVRLTVGRDPGREELDGDVAFARALREDEELSDHDALRHYCLMILNTNEFVYVD